MDNKEMTAKEKIWFILNYHEDFDRTYLLEDCLDMLTDEQFESFFPDYEDVFEEAIVYAKECGEYGD